MQLYGKVIPNKFLQCKVAEYLYSKPKCLTGNAVMLNPCSFMEIIRSCQATLF